MKNILYSFITILTFNANFATAQMTPCKFQYAISDKQKVVSIAPTIDSGFIVLLAFDTTIVPNLPVLVKTDVNFNTVWSKSLSGFHSDLDHNNSTVQQTQDGGFIILYETIANSGEISKFDSSGVFLWGTSHNNPFSSSYPGSFFSAKCYEKQDGKLIGMYAYQDGIFIYQLSPTGTNEWSRTFEQGGGSGKDPGFDVIPMTNGDVLFSGKSDSDNYFGRIDNLGNLLWSTVFVSSGTYNRPYCMNETSDSNIIVGGMRIGTSGTMGYLLKLSGSDGSVIWHKDVSDISFEKAIRIGNDKFLFTGMPSTQGLALAVFDSDGNLFNSKKILDVSDLNQNSRLFSKNGHIFLSGISNAFDEGFKFNFFELDENLDIPCKTTTLPISKVAFTSPVVFAGFLNETNTGSFISHIITTNTVNVSLNVTDFCSVVSTAELGSAQTLILDQNVPNPFTEMTTIKYSLNDGIKKAQMLFHDVVGKLIKSLDLQTTNGKGQLYVSANDLSKGIYTYSLVVDGKIIDSKRMIKNN